MIDQQHPGDWEKKYLELFSRAAESNLSRSGKAGRSSTGPEGLVETEVFDDICRKISTKKHQTILDLGCGCGPLVDLIINFSLENGHELTLMDQNLVMAQTRSLHGERDGLIYVEGIFPYDKNMLAGHKYDSIILYGVLHYIFDPINFLAQLAFYLKPGGHLLVGDIPNLDKKNRFIDTNFGAKIDKEYRASLINEGEKDSSQLNSAPYSLNDNYILKLVSYFRSMDFECYLLPQKSTLPYCYTREDLLIVRNNV